MRRGADAATHGTLEGLEVAVELDSSVSKGEALYGALHDTQGRATVYVGRLVDARTPTRAYIYRIGVAYINRHVAEDIDVDRLADLRLCHPHYSGRKRSDGRFATAYHPEADAGVGLWQCDGGGYGILEEGKCR